jgi:1-acyl-sn-glycerol-3-phosphate acyltransferase
MLDMNVVSHLPMPKGPKILVANHPTTCDPFILTSVSNGQAAVLVKNCLFDVPIFGSYLRWTGHIPVRSGEGKVALEDALARLKKGITIIVFIEGDLSKFIHKLGTPKTGAVRLALLSGAPLIPIGISVKKRNIKVMRSIIKGIQEWGKWYFKGPYALTIGKPFNITGTSKNRTQVKQLTKWLAEMISGLQKEGATRIK